MLFNKFIVAFVTAITLATSVAAAATPSPNGTGQNTGSPSQDKSQLEDKTQGSVQGSNQSSSKAPTCSPGLNPMCCDAIKPFSSLSDSFKTSLKSLDANLDQNGKVGQNCAPPVGSQGWYGLPSLIFLFDEITNARC
jgi:hypothetical protein